MPNMNINTLISKIKDFLDRDYKSKIFENNRIGKDYLYVDFTKVVSFDLELANSILDNFEETKAAFKLVLTDMLEDDSSLDIQIRFINVSASTSRDIWKLRAKDVNKFAKITAYIKKVGDIQHAIKVGVFECSSCGNVISIIMDDFYKQPTKCGCGCKKFKSIRNDLKDIQKVILEEDPKDLKPIQKPRTLLAILSDDLCKEQIDETLQPTKKVTVTGVIKDKQIKPYLTECTKYIEVNSIDIIHESVENIKINKKEIKELTEIAKSATLYEDMAQSIVPNIYGHQTVKIAVLLQLIGGVPLYIDNMLEERGLLHILLVSSPGTGKSVVLKRAVQFLPGARFASGKQASGVGIVAAVTKDDQLGWNLEAGVLPMASGSLLALDECDKIHKTDISHMNNAMVDLKVNIDKASIHGCYDKETEVLTEKGWLKHKDLIGTNIKVAQYDSNYIEFVQSKIYSWDYKGIMCHFSGRSVDICVTPDHRMLTRKRWTTNYKILRADDIGGEFLFKSVGQTSYNNKISLKNFFIRGIQYNQKRHNQKYHYDNHIDIPIELWLELSGYYLGDGSIVNNTIQFNLKKERKINKIFKCLYKISNNAKKNITKDNVTRITLYDPRIALKLISEYGKGSKNKKIPKWLFAIPSDYLKILWKSLMFCDGYKEKSFSTTSKELADDMQMLCVLIGKTSTLTLSKKLNYFTDNPYILYRLSITKNKEYILRKNNFKKEYYNGKIYCLSVPSGLYITRRNGKVAIQGNTLICETSVLAAANPKNRIFDRHQLIWKQIGLPKDFLDRFDLIFPMESSKDQEEHRKVGNMVVGKYRVESSYAKPKFKLDFVRKYIAYAKQNFKPQMNKEVQKYIVNNFLDLVRPADTEEDSAYFSYRLLTNIIRLTQAVAKTRLSNEILIKDAKRAIGILIESLTKQEIITKDGFDYERAESIVPKKKRDMMLVIKQTIRNLQNEDKEKTADYDMIKEIVQKENIEVDVLDEMLEKLKSNGDLMEAKRNKYKILN